MSQQPSCPRTSRHATGSRAGTLELGFPVLQRLSAIAHIISVGSVVWEGVLCPGKQHQHREDPCAQWAVRAGPQKQPSTHKPQCRPARMESYHPVAFRTTFFRAAQTHTFSSQLWARCWTLRLHGNGVSRRSLTLLNKASVAEGTFAIMVGRGWAQGFWSQQLYVLVCQINLFRERSRISHIPQMENFQSWIKRELPPAINRSGVCPH